MQTTLDDAAFEARIARHEDPLMSQQSAVFFRPFASASVSLELPHTGRCFLFCRRISRNDGTFADYSDLHEVSSSENHEAECLSYCNRSVLERNDILVFRVGQYLPESFPWSNDCQFISQSFPRTLSSLLTVKHSTNVNRPI